MKPEPPGEQFSNLNILRLLLAVLVTVSHSYPLTGTADPMHQYLGQVDGGRIGVWGFFFISGYLITRSYVVKPQALSFVLARVLRIWPALVVALFVSIGLAAYTSTAPDSVFWPAARAFYSYNVKLTEGVMYQLPGAFTGIPNGSVNGSLWTLPWELRMYGFVFVLGVFGILARRDSTNLALLLGTVFLIFLPAIEMLKPYVSNITVPWVLGAFLLGMAFYMNVGLDRQVRTLLVGLAVGVLILLCTNFQNTGWLLVICSSVGLLGFTDIVKLPKVENDLSYGVYIYSFPVQQFVIWESGIRNPWVVSFYTLGLVFVLAAVSWFAVERPAIRLRKRVTDFLKAKNVA